jgi:hypothetical protein
VEPSQALFFLFHQVAKFCLKKLLEVNVLFKNISVCLTF